MSGNNTTGFNVLDMAQDYAESQGVDVKDLFAQPQQEAPAPATEPQPEDEGTVTPVRRDSKRWVPDEALMEGMDELNQGGVVYDASEVKMDEEPGLKNILDEDAKAEAIETMDELHRKEYNIEAAKKRHGIINFNIPTQSIIGGGYTVRIMNAAGDTDYNRAQAGLDEVFNEIKTAYPEFITEWASDAPENPANKANQDTPIQQDIQIGDKIISSPDSTNADSANTSDQQPVAKNNVAEPEGEVETKVIVDKSQLPEISWTPEEMEKIKRSRSVELNIIEAKNLEFSEISNVPDNMVDSVISTYMRKANDVTAALPASKYRCTFTGLTYPEVIDLSNANEMNNIDGERKKWSLCFEHMRNQSIGPWEEYKWYIDPSTGNKVKLGLGDPDPIGVDRDLIYRVSKFDDFLMKTSFMDLEFMLWKILCATAMNTEIISIDCHAKLPNGQQCNHNYDWLYHPDSLLQLDSINPAILEEMKVTGEVAGIEQIMENYQSSMLMKRNTVKLPNCGLTVVFGHISAYDYLNSIYGEIRALEELAETDPTIASKGLNYTTLTVIKEFLVPKDGGGFGRIAGSENLIKLISNLDEVDWQTLGELVRMTMEPYQFAFALRDIVCPKCKNRSSIPIESMTQLLFIVARSLSSVNVVFKTP